LANKHNITALNVYISNDETPAAHTIPEIVKAHYEPMIWLAANQIDEIIGLASVWNPSYCFTECRPEHPVSLHKFETRFSYPAIHESSHLYHKLRIDYPGDDYYLDLVNVTMK
jgi:hypothetical protein